MKMTSGDYFRVNDWLQEQEQQQHQQEQPSFHNFLIQTMNEKSAWERIRYARQYSHILQTGNAQELLQLSGEKRIHIMKALGALARFTGSYDNWLAIKQRYNLKWSTGTEKLDAFEQLLSDESKSLDKMLEWLIHARRNLPRSYGDILLYCTLTGLRSSECLASIRLIQDPEAFKTYYNEDRGILEHFRFKETFIRRTKSAYLSIVDKELLQIAQNIEKLPKYDALRFTLTRRGVGGMHMAYCRKIFASKLRESGVEAELIDLVQGRIGKSIFLRHYYRPNLSSYRGKILNAVNRLRKEIEG